MWECGNDVGIPTSYTHMGILIKRYGNYRTLKCHVMEFRISLGHAINDWSRDYYILAKNHLVFH